jgi:hypothetical protein
MSDLLDELAASEEDRDDGLRAYADQLILRGDPFGELIVVALERVVRSTPELARRESALIDVVQAKLHERLHPYRPTYRWRTGFLDEVRFELDTEPSSWLLEALEQEPCCRLLRRIELVAAGEARFGNFLGHLIELAPRFPRLAELVVRSRELARQHARVSVPIRAAFPRLELLHLDATHVAPDSLELPRLHTLVLDGLGPSQLRTIIAPPLPKLAQMSLRFEPFAPSNVDATFGPLLHRSFPALRELALGVPPAIQPWLAQELPRSPLVRELHRLVLWITDERALETLLAAPQLLHHLVLVLEAALMTVAMRRRFVRAFRPAIEFL